jgi:hypothetical protein
MYSNVRKSMSAVAITAALASLVFTAQAHDTHGKPQYGGIVAEAASFQAELVIKQTEVIIY